MIKTLVEKYLQTGLVDPQLLEGALKVGSRRGKTPKTDIEKRKKARQYYMKHRAEILKKAKLYRMKNKRRLAAYAKAYRKKFGESLETWDDILAQLNDLLDVAEEVDSRLALIILQAINEIETGLVSDEDLPDYQEMVAEIEDILYGDTGDDSSDDMTDDGGYPDGTDS